MLKKKKTKHKLGKKEFIFNFISLLFMIGVGLYFGFRSLYYYSRQNQTIKKEANTLSSLVISNNPILEEGEGLLKDQDGFYFKGNIINNYVLFNNQLFRIIRINNDNTVKLANENYVASFPWGNDYLYQKSNIKEWLNKNEKDYSGVYYHTLTEVEEQLIKTTYTEDILKNNKIDTGKKKYSDYISIPTIKDYNLAGGKNSYLNNGKVFFLLGYNTNKGNIFIEEDGTIQTSDYTSGYGIRPVITLKKENIVESGNGTLESPYIIKQDNNSYINKVVKLGNDYWIVYYDYNNILKLHKYGYITNKNNQEVLLPYSNNNSIFNTLDKKNIAYYLNTSYLSSLEYQSILLNTDFYNGEISDDTGYLYSNIYNNKVNVKIGLLNIFDYHASCELNDFFHLNTTSQVGSMEYNLYKSGLLEEADVREVKHIVPVISISKDVIKSGVGTIENPYKMEW